MVSDTLHGQRAEMMAAAQQAVLSPNPLDHWLMSWREGEFPTNVEVDKAVAIFTDHMKLGPHQCIYAVHGDTHNRHVHLAINRYDHINERMVSAGHGFAIEEGHKALAKITAHFGWSGERNARYVMQGGEPVLSKSAKQAEQGDREPLTQEAAAYENRTGYRSNQQIAQVEALPIMLEAKSWRDLHARLADKGFAYERTRTTNGAAIIIGAQAVKASHISRLVTVKRLSEKFGAAFEPRAADVIVRPRAIDVDIMEKAFRADEFRKQRETARAARARTKQASWPQERKRLIDEIDAAVHCCCRS